MVPDAHPRPVLAVTVRAMLDPLYDATDYRRAITATLAARGLLQRSLAQALERSEGWLSLVLSGQRVLDPDLVDGIAAFLGFDPDRSLYFSALVDLDSRSPRTKRAAWSTVQATQRQRSAAQFTEDIARAYASWYVAAITELARCDGFRADPAWIASTLQPQVSVAEAEAALMLLVRLGQLVPDDEGGLRPGSEIWSASELPPGPISEAIARLHRDALGIAVDAIDTARYNERHNGTVIFAISEERYAAFLAQLRELERQLVSAATEPGDDPNRVYLLSLQLFPVSGYTDTESEPVNR